MQDKLIIRTNVTLQSETVLNSPPTNNIHEGQISHTHGFVPYQPLSPSLPLYYSSWEKMGKNLPRYIGEGLEREMIKALPMLDTDEARLPNEHLSRAIAIIGNLAHAYYYNQRLGNDQHADPLPDNLLTPWQQLTRRIQRKLPLDAPANFQAIRIHYDTFLTNWKLINPKLIDGKHNSEIELNDLAMLDPIFNNSAERNFNMTFVIMELRFAKALPFIMEAIKAVANQDEEALIEALYQVTRCIEEIAAALDYINPNKYSQHYVDPTLWTKTIAKMDGKIPGGNSGVSGSAMPLFHVLDAFIERHAYESTMGKTIHEKYKHQPAHVISYLSALRDDLARYSIRAFVQESTNSALKNRYDLLIASYVGEQGLLGVHALKVYGYMKINFRNGRLLTNGGHDGTSTVATEPQRHIYDDFVMANSERLGNYLPVQQYATKIKTHYYSNRAASITLDVTHTALRFQPGDHCTIQPINSEEKVELFLQQHNWKSHAPISLNATWQQFFLRQFAINVNEKEVGEVLFYTNLRLLQAQQTEFNIENLKLLTPRYYSVSPLIDCPQHIRLTVGIHTNGDGKALGLCSTYLTSNEIGIFAIDRAPARHFHLPKSKETPIIMFAAGTGISPFLGFITERAQYSDKDKNILFFSTANLDSFYYQEELGELVRSGKLNLHTIFSQGANYNSGEFSPQIFETNQKYAGNHVDQLIEEQAPMITSLIVDQQAQVYVCGNPKFADTVRDSLVKALDEHNTVVEPTAYINRMIADFRFVSDVYAPSDYTQQYPELFISDIIFHNKAEDCWGIINGGVYNLTKLIHSHPGGQKIIMVNAGIDMSDDYNYIKHNQRPQIEIQLQQCKIGVLAHPHFPSPALKAVYDQCKKFVEALTEMENTLRNNTEFQEEVKPYLWREVYRVFVDGSLASYRKPGAGNAGSLTYVLGPLLQELSRALNFSSDKLKVIYSTLISNASTCADCIYKLSIGPLTTDALQDIKRSFDKLLDETFQFINNMKLISAAILSEIEKNTDNFNETAALEKLNQLGNAMDAYSELIASIISALPKEEKERTHKKNEQSLALSFTNATISRVNREADNASNAQAMKRFGIMPFIKQTTGDLLEKDYKCNLL